LLLGAAVIALFGAGAVRHFESLAARDIKSKLHGEKGEVSVRTVPRGLLGHLSGDLRRVNITARHFSADGLPLFTEPDRSQAGRAGDVQINLEDFRIAGLRIESLKASIPDCRFDFPLAKRKGQIRLSKSGTGTGSVTILASDLEAFILSKFREIKTVSVRLDDGRLHVEGYGEFLLLKSQFAVYATLIAVDGSKLALENAHIILDGQAASNAASEALLQLLNPVVDLDKDLHLFGAIHVDKIELSGNKLVASGTTTIPVRPRS
jgi:hypothetical protein